MLYWVFPFAVGLDPCLHQKEGCGDGWMNGRGVAMDVVMCHNDRSFMTIGQCRPRPAFDSTWYRAMNGWDTFLVCKWVELGNPWVISTIRSHHITMQMHYWFQGFHVDSEDMFWQSAQDDSQALMERNTIQHSG